jgi:hypothetical protein
LIFVTLLRNGQVRIPAFPTQWFSEYTGQRNINPLLRNIQAERVLPWQRIRLTVKRFLSNQIVAGKHEPRNKVSYILYGRIGFKEHSDSQKLRIPYVYGYITKLCRRQAEVILNHENPNVHAIGQG